MTAASDELRLGERSLTLATLCRVARQGSRVTLDSSARARIAAAHALLLSLVADGAAVYGMTTGLGAAVDTRVSVPDPATQRSIPLARAVGVGREARTDEVRAIIAARLSRLAVGRSGMSLPTAVALQELLNHRIHPIVPMTGSIGEADLAPLAAVALAVLGEGEVEFEGRRLPASDALAQAGLVPPGLAGKDGLALVSSNAASVGVGALVASDAGVVLQAMEAGAALSFEGYRANVSPLAPWAAQARPAQGQARAALALRGWLAHGDLMAPGAARQLQDPLSFRCAASVLGAARHAWLQACEAIELELDSSDDNPAVIVEGGIVLANANFDATHLALSFEHLGLALTRVAASAAEWIMKLMSPGSSGLPRFLVDQAGQTGLATLQKTVSALMAEIGHIAQPMSALTVAVADRVEDYASQAMGIVAKTADLIERLRLLAAIELLVAAQAVDLRSGVRLGQATARLQAGVRERVAHRSSDRPATPDILALAAWIAEGGVQAISPAEP